VPVGGHLDRRRRVPQRTGEEPPGCRGVPVLGEQHVDDLPELVDRPVRVPPATSHLQVAFVHKPAVTCGRVLFLEDGRIVDELTAPTAESVLDRMKVLELAVHQADGAARTGAAAQNPAGA
jgi:hypothetical protein